MAMPISPRRSCTRSHGSHRYSRRVLSPVTKHAKFGRPTTAYRNVAKISRGTDVEITHVRSCELAPASLETVSLLLGNVPVVAVKSVASSRNVNTYNM